MEKENRPKKFQVWRCDKCGDIILVESRPFSRICSIRTCQGELNLTDEGDNIQEFLRKSWEK